MKFSKKGCTNELDLCILSINGIYMDISLIREGGVLTWLKN